MSTPAPSHASSRTTPSTARDSVLKELVITDTVPLPPEKRLPVITVLSVAELFAGAIERIHEGRVRRGAFSLTSAF